jgi:hypothetical protein
MQEEIWKSLSWLGYDNYEISTTGNVRNQKTKRIIKPDVKSKKDPYLRVFLSKPKQKLKKFRLNRLVLLCFNPIENPEQYHVHHKDNNKNNNSIENLEWLTRKDHVKAHRILKIKNSLQLEFDLGLDF